MTTAKPSVLMWAPRIAGLAVALFLAVCALDAFNGKSFFEAVPGFLIHLAPSVLVLLVVALAWRLPLAGAVAFPLLALGYATMVHWRSTGSRSSAARSSPSACCSS